MKECAIINVAGVSMKDCTRRGKKKCGGSKKKGCGGKRK